MEVGRLIVCGREPGQNDQTPSTVRDGGGAHREVGACVGGRGRIRVRFKVRVRARVRVRLGWADPSCAGVSLDKITKPPQLFGMVEVPIERWVRAREGKDQGKG